MMRSYLLIFTPVFAAGVLAGLVAAWGIRSWRAASRLIAETEHAADEQPVPYWPTGKAVDDEWDRIVSALKEDGL